MGLPGAKGGITPPFSENGRRGSSGKMEKPSERDERLSHPGAGRMGHPKRDHRLSSPAQDTASHPDRRDGNFLNYPSRKGKG